MPSESISTFECLQATSQEIPTVIKSCIRVLNLYGMHHQGIFRIPGSQVEINDLKNAFEKGIIFLDLYNK